MNEETPVTKKSKKKLSKLSKMNMIVIALMIVSLGLAGYFYMEAQDAKSNSDEAVAARNLEESNRVLEKLNKILVTNSDVEPTVARVEDPGILRDANPDFYGDVIVGDFIVLYPQRAIIYRESENKVINVAPIINTSQLAPSTDEADDIETGESETN